MNQSLSRCKFIEMIYSWEATFYLPNEAKHGKLLLTQSTMSGWPNGLLCLSLV